MPAKSSAGRVTRTAEGADIVADSGAVGMLHVVPTPIGNLEDITLRALRVLREAEFIAAEDTRRTLKLLNHFEIRPRRLFSYREHNARAAGEQILGLLARGQSGALVSDAGMPGISDPGQELVAALAERGMPITVLPGPSALLAALVGSGLPTRPFSFYGFLDRDEKARRKELTDLVGRPETAVFYEAPHRLRATLRDLYDILGERRAVVARELTKVHEVYARGTLAGWAQSDGGHARGEVVLVVAGNEREAECKKHSGMPEGEPAGEWPVALTLAEHVELLTRRGLTKKEAMRAAAQSRNISRREVYAALLSSAKGEAAPGGRPPHSP